MKKRVCAVVRGCVQGVGFRMYACHEAIAQGLTGWIRNREDGSVEIIAEGESEALSRFLAWVRRGPPLARVCSVDIHEEGATGEFPTFRIVR